MRGKTFRVSCLSETNHALELYGMSVVIFSVLFLGFMALFLLPLSYASGRRAAINEHEARTAWKRVLEKQQGVRSVLDELSSQVQRSLEAENRLRERIADLVAQIDAQAQSEQSTPESHEFDQRAAALLEQLCDIVDMQVKEGEHAYKETANALAAANADRARAVAVYGELTSEEAPAAPAGTKPAAA